MEALDLKPYYVVAALAASTLAEANIVTGVLDKEVTEEQKQQHIQATMNKASQNLGITKGQRPESAPERLLSSFGRKFETLCSGLV